jgi:hypothetical protein
MLVEVKHSRRRIFDAILNRSVLRISSETVRNFAILRNKNSFHLSVYRMKNRIRIEFKYISIVYL